MTPKTLAWLLTFAATAGVALADLTLHVAPHGDDRAAATAEAPLASPAAALQRVAEARAAGENTTIIILLHAGDYVLADSLKLKAAHGGSESGPTILTGPATGVARLLGGRKLIAWRPVPAGPMRDRLPKATVDCIRQVDLRAGGIDQTVGLAEAGFGSGRATRHAQLYIGSEPMPLAGYPNTGYLTIVRAIGKRQFAVDDDRPAGWARPQDAWAFGYWYHDWADGYRPVATYDKAMGVIELGGHRDPPYGTRAGQRFRFLNVPEELDAPGEWYVDRETGILYFHPPGDGDGAEAALSLLQPPLITIEGASFIQVRKLVGEFGCGGGVRIDGGQGIEIVGCVLRNLGSTAVAIDGGRDHRVEHCRMYNLDEDGVRLSGGDRKTLTPSGFVVDNCDIHHFGRWVRTYQPGVRMSGVGHVVRHCRIHDAPHAGILLSGNDHLIEFTEIDHVATDTGDVGAIYIGRDWSMRGNAVRHCHIHDVTGMGMGAMGVYNDDCASGMTVRGCVFRNVGRAMMIGGGRDNVAENNIFVDCNPALHLDARGLTWDLSNRDSSWRLEDKLKKWPYESPPWSRKYPELACIFEGNPWEPAGNRFVRNVVVGGKLMHVAGQAKPFLTMESNFTEGEAGFVDVGAGDFRLREGSPVWKLGFEPIPFERIGLRQADLDAACPPAE